MTKKRSVLVLLAAGLTLVLGALGIHWRETTAPGVFLDVSQVPSVGVSVIGSGTSAVTAMALSDDERLLLTGDNDGSVALWETPDRGAARLRWQVVVKKDSPVTAVAIAPDEEVCLAASAPYAANKPHEPSVLTVLGCRDGMTVRRFEGPPWTFGVLALSADHKLALLGDISRGSAVSIWDVESGSELLLVGQHSWVTDAWFASGGGVHSADDGGEVREWSHDLGDERPGWREWRQRGLDLAAKASVKPRPDLVRRTTVWEELSDPPDMRVNHFHIGGSTGGTVCCDGLTASAKQILVRAQPRYQVQNSAIATSFTVTWSPDQTLGLSGSWARRRAPVWLWHKRFKDPIATLNLPEGDFAQRSLCGSHQAFVGTDQGTIYSLRIE